MGQYYGNTDKRNIVLQLWDKEIPYTACFGLRVTMLRLYEYGNPVQSDV